MARLIRMRPTEALYHNIFRLWGELHSNEEEFTELFGLNKTQFETLYVMLQPAINLHPIQYLNREIRTRDQTALYLRFLASGQPFGYHEGIYKIPDHVIEKIVDKINVLILQTLRPIVMPPPSLQLWLEQADDFMRIYQMPHCLGSVYGRFLNIPGHKTHVLMLIINAKQKFVIVDVGDYDTIPERIWHNSLIGRNFENKVYDLPPKQSIGTYKKQLPYVLVGGNSFPVRPFLINKFMDEHDEARKVFDCRINVVKENAEEAVTRLRRRWKFIQCAIYVPIEKIEDLIISAACLENYFSPLPVRQYLSSENEVSLSRVADLRQTIPRNSHDVRDKFLDYFLSPQGQVPWQFEEEKF